MPYVNEDDRKRFDASLIRLHKALDGVTPGMLNYLITRILLFVWHSSPQNYATIAMIDGVLGTVQKEWYRRITVPYEESKMAEHGDVY